MRGDLTLVAGPAAAHAPLDEFTDAMSVLATGVVVVTCRVGGRPWGTTVTSFASVSADPPTVLVSLAADAATAGAIALTERFGVSILGEDHVHIARYASVPGEAKFLEGLVERGRSASPALAGALAHVDCELVEAVTLADHVVLFGQVRDATAVGEGVPLVYHRRTYRKVSDALPPQRRSARCLSS